MIRCGPLRWSRGLGQVRLPLGCWVRIWSAVRRESGGHCYGIGLYGPGQRLRIEAELVRP